MAKSRARFLAELLGSDGKVEKAKSDAGIYAGANVTIASDGTLTTTTLPLAGGTLTGNLKFNDNVQAKFGTGEDLVIYHHPSNNNSYIQETGTGSLMLLGTNIHLMNAAGTENKLVATSDGAVSLYHNNVKKFETNSGGVTVTGTAILGGASFLDNATVYVGTGLDLRIYHDGNNSYITDVGTGNLKIGGANVEITTAGGTKYLQGGSNVLRLYHTGNERMRTSSAGIYVTGTVQATGNIVVSGTVDGIDIATRDALHAPKASPGLTGTPTAPTASGSTNTTQLATTAFVQQEITTLIGGAPSTLNDLNELAAAINDDANYNSTLTTALATKLPLAGGTLTGHALFTDGIELRLGTDTDMGLFSSSGTSHIRVNSGIFKLRADDMRFTAQNGTTERGRFNSAGLTVSGSLALTSAGSQLQLGPSNNMQIYHNGGAGEIQSANNLTLDVAGDISLDADSSGQVRYKDGGAEYLSIFQSNSDVVINSSVADKDIIFKGKDGASNITALTLDMSDFGSAIFTAAVDVGTTLTAAKLVATNGILELDDNGSHNGIINAPASLRINIDSDNGNTGESFQVGHNQTGINSNNILFKVEESGAATFSAGVTVGGTLSAGALTIPGQGMIFNQAFGTGVPSITMTGTANNGRGGAINFKESNGSGGAIANTAAIYSTDGAGGNSSYGGLTIAAYQSDIRFSTGTLAGTKMIVQAGGNVGIGIAAPAQKLHVGGTSRFDDTMRFAARGLISWGTLAGGTGFGIQAGSGNGLSLGSNGAWDKLVIDTAGNVGIGIADPDHKLEVKSSGSSVDQISLVHSGNTVQIASLGQESSHGSLHLRANSNAVKVRLSAGGNHSYILDSRVGIGTTNPTGKFEVAVTQGSGGLFVSTSSSTNDDAQYQVIVCQNILATTNTWYDVCFVTHSPTLDILGRVVANDNTSHGGVGVVYHLLGMYGSVSTHLKTTQAYNNTSTFATNGTGLLYRYLNGGASSGSYRLQVKAIWSNSSHNAYAYTTVRGMADGTIYEDD